MEDINAEANQAWGKAKISTCSWILEYVYLLSLEDHK